MDGVSKRAKLKITTALSSFCLIRQPGFSARWWYEGPHNSKLDF